MKNIIGKTIGWIIITAFVTGLIYGLYTFAGWNKITFLIACFVTLLFVIVAGLYVAFQLIFSEK